MFRPENLTLAPPDITPPAGQIAWRGRVGSAIFRGATRSLIVETEGDALHVEAAALRSAALGDSVAVLAYPAQSWA